MANKTVKKVRLRRKFGKNAPEMISNLVITSAYAAIVELGANSYDADATRVNVEHDPESEEGGVLSIVDNGLGMNPEDLIAFYKLGDSPKLEERISPGGRICIGKFGVGTILLKYLGNNYTLVTRKNGLETRVEETFKGQLRSNVEIPFETKKVDPALHGTEITIHDLNFGEETGFTIGLLRRKIQWDLPILPDFKVTVNDEPIETIAIKNATEFRIDKTWKHLGHLHGSIYLTGKATNVSGIHVYVNGRRVGDPNSLMYLNKIAIAKCIIGILHADDLEEAILFDRGKFREDHPGYRQLKDAVKQALLKVSQHYRDISVVNRQEKVRSNVPLFLQKLRKRCVDTEIEGIDRLTAFSLADNLSARTVGRYDAKNNTVLLNERHPALVIRPGQTTAQYEAALLHAFVDVLAERRVRAKEQVSLDAFLREKEKIWRQINSAESEEIQERINSLAVYSWQDIARHTGRSEDELDFLRARKVLPKGSESIVGQVYLDFAKKVEGMVSLYSIMQDIYGDNLSTVEVRLVSDAIANAGNTARPFAKNLGTKKNTCIFIESCCADEIAELVKDETFENNAKDRLQTLHDRFCTLPELAEAMDDELPYISRVLDYAKKNSIKIRQETAANTVKFNYADFITAVQKMRKSV
ncbi:ATP-binding protein [Candidatus Woesearchaeota archaeon]|nr:ATP-binding protein [Candidatus Woesearchaeota archaeon]